MTKFTKRLFVLIQGVLAVSSFNIDKENPTIFRVKNDSFGYKVIQFSSSHSKRVLVSAPRMESTPGTATGGIYSCDYKSDTCAPVNAHALVTQSAFLGLTMITMDSQPSQAVVCGPVFSHECETNVFLNGICHIYDSDLHITRNITPAFKECRTGLDVAILYDDSQSISDNDFATMKRFMLDIIGAFKDSNVLFAAAHFSTEFNIVFDFNHYNKGLAESDLRDFPHTKGNTITPTAMKKAAEEIFIKDAGARSNANKLLITITDGASTDTKTTFEEAIEACNRKDIIRYAIGVGSVLQNELQKIASEPANIFEVGNFIALDSLKHQLNKKLRENIFVIEGTNKSSDSSSFQNELSQGGFSALMTKDSIVFGAVGAYEWSGGLEEVRKNQTQFLNFSLGNIDMKDSYLGYSVEFIKQKEEGFYIAGAPRYKHMGRVVVFQKSLTNGSWYPAKHIDGDQVGSYFGAELCAVDLTKDDVVDLLLIGAPMYHEDTAGGIVKVCTVTFGLKTELSCNATLYGATRNLYGRFGTAISAIGDINGDRFTDVAIGAPLENDHQGSIYIFHGDQTMIREPYSQRITGVQLSQGLKYFGQSIHGIMDVSEDGLTDIAVGALNAAVLLRSRPVLNVSATINFNPSKIPLTSFECSEDFRLETNLASNITVCFEVRNLHDSRLGTPHANLTLQMILDSQKSQSRLLFENLRRTISESIEINLKERCMHYIATLPSCVDDFSSPVRITLNFSLFGLPFADSRGLRPVLNQYSNTTLTAELPFEKNCGPDNVCVADMKVSFNFSGESHFVVSDLTKVNVTVNVENRGEDAFNTLLTFYYPPGLSYHKVSLLQFTKQRPSITLADANTLGFQTSRNITFRFTNTIFKANATAIFAVTFDFSGDWPQNETFKMTAGVASDNENDTLEDNMHTQELPVLYAINVMIEGAEFTQYIHFFTTKTNERKIAEHSYKVTNIGTRTVPLTVTLFAPVQLEHGFIWNVSDMVNHTSDSSVCKLLTEGRVTNAPGKRQSRSTKGCTASLCKKFQCETGPLPWNSAVTFSLTGELLPVKDLKELKLKQLTFETQASLAFTAQYTQRPKDAFHRAEITTSVEFVEEINKLPIILGSLFGGLILLLIITVVLYKIGFFKRKYSRRNAESSQQTAPDKEATQKLDAANSAGNEPEKLSEQNTVSGEEKKNGVMAEQNTASSEGTETGAGSEESVAPNGKTETGVGSQ
ncbi:integrin alpha-L [Protopterus annectens]|uniref:integrin alpha-L n=1 Tax=Protopterus annectens TaxID=7888 RepID=UPI001CF94C42|nr:integrin alpha-L [Protopterus annectens]